MSTYLAMWGRIKAMNQEQVDHWITSLSPSKGNSVHFYGIDVNDVDLLEALKLYKEDLERDVRIALRQQKTRLGRE